MIRTITSAGVVTTIAGTGSPGSSDGDAKSATFHEPRGVAADASGNIFVADYMNHIVRKITPSGVVSTYAGSAGQEGAVDATGNSARFRGLYGVAVDRAGNVYVSDTGNRVIRKISPSQAVTTFAGSFGGSGTTDGTGSAARFSEPRGISIDAADNLYVAEPNANTVRKISPAGVVTTVAGTPPLSGSTDGPRASARFYLPSQAALGPDGNLLVADTSNGTIRKVDPSGNVTTFAGLAGRSSAVDGPAATARFEDPYSLATDDQGNVYVADSMDHTVRLISPSGVVTTLAGMAGQRGSVDGLGSAARFSGPQGIAVDRSGNVYVADTGNQVIRRIAPDGTVTTVAGRVGETGKDDGAGTAARFSDPNGIAVDGAGTLYVADTSSGTIRRITSAGVVSTLAGSAGQMGFTDGKGSEARFRVPFDITVDAAGILYVCDHGNHAIRKITAAGEVSTLAGNGNPGSADGDGRSASFQFPSGVGVASDGTVYVADTDNQTIRAITASGSVSTVGGSVRARGSTDGSGAVARFFNPKDIVVSSSGILYVADRSNHTVRKGTR